MEVSNLLRCQFIVWAWDMTQHQNRQTFYEWLNMNNLGGVIADSIRVIAPNKYPLLVVLVKDRAQFHRSTVIYGLGFHFRLIQIDILGQESKESTIQKLMVSLDHYQQIREQERQEERNRIEREQFRREQAEEYERSLAADRVKEQEKRRKQEEARLVN
jgi:FAS-associated factor 1